MGYISIKIRMKQKFGNLTTTGKAICKDGVCLTAFNNQKQTEMTYKAMKKQGKDVTLENGIIIERIEGATKEEIAEKIIQDIKNLSEKMKHLMEVKYSKKVVK